MYNVGLLGPDHSLTLKPHFSPFEETFDRRRTAVIMPKIQLDTVTNKEAGPQTISKTFENIPKITTQQLSKLSSILLKLQIQRYASEKFYRRTVLAFLAKPSKPLIDRNALPLP